MHDWPERLLAAARALLSDFLQSGNQLGNIDANDGAFAQTALDIELKVGSVKHAQPLSHVTEPDAFDVHVR